jgi:hypothetical protein
MKRTEEFAHRDFTLERLKVFTTRMAVRVGTPSWFGRGLFVCFGLTLFGCSGPDREVLVPADVINVASDAHRLEASSSLGLWAALFPISSVDPRLGLSANVAAAKSSNLNVRPKSCLVTQVTGNRVQYSYNKCFGPLGLVELNGDVQVRFESADDGIDAELSGTLTLGVAPLQFAGRTRIRTVGAERAVQWEGTVSGSRKKQAFVLDSREEWRFGRDGCWTRTGLVTGERSNRSRFSVEHDQIRRCDFRTCPSGRMRVVGNLIRNPSRRFAADLLFDGTSTLRVRDEAGEEHTAALACDENL